MRQNMSRKYTQLTLNVSIITFLRYEMYAMVFETSSGLYLSCLVYVTRIRKFIVYLMRGSQRSRSLKSSAHVFEFRNKVQPM